MIKFATVTSEQPFKVKFDTDKQESGNTGYKRLASYTPRLNDRVVFVDDGKNKICLGKVE